MKGFMWWKPILKKRLHTGNGKLGVSLKVLILFLGLEELQDIDVWYQKYNTAMSFECLTLMLIKSIGYFLKTQTCLWRSRFGLSVFLVGQLPILLVFAFCSEITYWQAFTSEKRYTYVKSSWLRFIFNEMWKFIELYTVEELNSLGVEPK